MVGFVRSVLTTEVMSNAQPAPMTGAPKNPLEEYPKSAAGAVWIPFIVRRESRIVEIALEHVRESIRRIRHFTDDISVHGVRVSTDKTA